MTRWILWHLAVTLFLLVLPACSAGEDVASEAPVPAEPSIVQPANDCFADGTLADFPWPPPQYSAAYTVPRSLVLFGMDNGTPSLTDIAFRLEGGLDGAGYTERAFYGIGCDGFAVITRMERIDATGKPVEGAERFAPVQQDAAFSLSRYIAELFYAEPGFYRQIIFVVTPKRVENDGTDATEEELEELLDAGADRLTDAFDRAPFTPAHDVTALIYEFRAEGNRDAESVIPSRLPAVTHLSAAGISDGIEAAGRP